MGLYSLILENKWALEILYALAISLICAVIVFKIDRFYRLSTHQGIRYFRNAFFFYGIAFIARYVLGFFSDISNNYLYAIQIIFEYFLVMAGFFLFYSLIWKKIELPKEHYKSSLFNMRIAIFHLMAIVIAVFDSLWHTYDFMFFSQIIIFIYATMIAYSNYKRNGKQRMFLKFYFIAMTLILVAWLLNLSAALFFQWHPFILINIGIINVTFFILFLYGVLKVTR